MCGNQDVTVDSGMLKVKVIFYTTTLCTVNTSNRAIHEILFHCLINYFMLIMQFLLIHVWKWPQRGQNIVTLLLVNFITKKSFTRQVNYMALALLGIWENF